MANWKWFGKVHAFVYQKSKGRIGAKMAGIDIVLMETIGRKSGLQRTVPAACYPYKESVLVVASNNGLPEAPVWWLNLKARPDIHVRLGEESFLVRARELQGLEREEVWPLIVKLNPRQKHYARIAERTLPVIYLERVVEK
jgi:deazaflavin-dependent oxidoreductase (nitroreductase family)